MKIKTPKGTAFISDTSDLAVAIKAGHDIIFDPVTGKPSAGPLSGNLNTRWQLLIAVKTATTAADLKKILAAMILIMTDDEQ